MDIRIGLGYDVHRLTEGRPLALGGVIIPHTKGPEAHSDGDVIIHALCDALLGALALGDIGMHFPDTDSAHKNLDSKIFLKKIIALIHDKGFYVVNMDCSLMLEKPKIRSWVPAMCAVLAGIMGIAEDRVSIKATTSEKLGFVGREEGIAAHVIVLLSK